ncbi:Retinoic acid induced 16-like protein-domain-containing protein [Mucor mucedo]|uniref:Retinoic acid induced 16-like protein-domain-containing protein n=1 Tax=Mucor mucedo TaxID=29922 RepID=UPI0022205B5C|nr:Retinoic acid induced 16-like protein-domain-containing protein [Mucor mucedo]KAI7896808.1 Retinoic acid induced 16-like protein-domain-containing protein [Mucor mucedo]
MQLAKFHKCWEYVHNIFVMDDRKTNMHVQQTEIPPKLRQMVDLLVDEEARQEDNTTGVCMEYFLKNGVLQYLVTVAEKADYPVGIRGEAIRAIASMVDLLDDRFLVHNAVHKPTIKLLRFCVLDDRQSELYSDDLVDLMYIICSKIHGFPALLNIFFHDKHWLTTPQKSSDHHPLHETIEQEPEYEFLLFTYLLRFVHREGRSGDFARTGLLFIMEMANDQLGDFILGSDFATIMAAGLGALYSQLPRKLIVQDEDDQIYANPTSFLLGQDSIESIPSHNNIRFPVGLGAEYSNSPEFKYQLDSFLKLLEFCQDVLTRCPNAEISLSLLTSVRTIFLENILYPSILECSDIDGSSVAVISYIDIILQTIQQEDLARVVVGYLIDDEDQQSSGPSLVATPAPTTEEAEDYIASAVEKLEINRKNSTSTHFTLKDLIFSRLKSNSQTTVIATLKLLKTIIKNHCQYSLNLLSIYPDNLNNPTIISHHLREVELYFSLIIAIDSDHAKDVLACGYEDYLRDVEMTIDSDYCYQSISPANAPTDGNRNSTQEMPKAKRRRSFKYGQRYEDIKKEEREEQEKRQKRKQNIKCHGVKTLSRHRIRSTDPLLQILLSLLSHFFTQSSELNLALTGVITALALCPYRSLQGWISFSETDRTNRDDILVLNSDGQPAVNKTKIRSQDIYAHYDTSAPVDEDDDDDDRSVDFGADRESAKMTSPTYFKSYPPFFTLLRTLTQQVDYYRSEIQAFDKLLEERRNALIAGETSFLDNRVIKPSTSLSTGNRSISTGAQQLNTSGILNRRPSVLRSSLSTDPTPVLSPSSSSSTMALGSSPRISANPPQVPPINMNVIMNNPMSPLALHVRKTSSMRIQPLFPSNFVSEREEPILDLDDEDEHTFAPKSADPSRPKRIDKSTEITLSMLLNNVVILEESIKELVALMQVRRSLGIDEISYV